MITNHYNASGATGANGIAYNGPLNGPPDPNQLDSISILILNEPIEVCKDNTTPIGIPLPIEFASGSSGNYTWKPKYTDDQLIGGVCRNYGFTSGKTLNFFDKF